MPNSMRYIDFPVIERVWMNRVDWLRGELDNADNNEMKLILSCCTRIRVEWRT